MSFSADLKVQILSWDFAKAYSDFKRGIESDATCKKLPDRFLDSEEYIEAFREPCLMELKASILNSAATDSLPRYRGVFELARTDESSFSKKPKSELIEIHAVLVDQVRARKEKTIEPAIPADTLCAIVNGDYFDSKHCVLAIVAPGKGPTGEPKLKILACDWPMVSAKNIEWNLVPITSLISTIREYEAMYSMEKIFLKEELLLGMANADSDKTLLESETPVPEQLMDALSQKLNMSQMDVIDDLCLPPSGEGRSKIHLVRGPPGSGKTMTLNAILNAIHVQQYTAYYDAIAEAVKNGKFSTNERSWLDLTKISKPRIIVCAPSNVAIDNIILRIYTEKFLDGHCREYIPRLVRIGKGGQNNPQVAERALARLVEKQLKKPGRDVVEKISKLESLYSEYRHGVLVQVTKLHVMISGTPHAFRAGIETRVATNPDGLLAPYWVDHTNQTTSNSLPPAAAVGEPTAPQVEHMQEYLLYARELMRFLELWENTHWKLQRYRLVQAYIQESVATTSAAAERYQIATNLETLFLNQASIVCGTLSSSGLSQVCDSLPFHTCVVDEAAQSVELSTLIPLRLGVKKLVLVGDPQQLPATVICKREKLGNYERSLFERLESCGLPVHTLNLQYRMHPAISHFPRHVFYQGTLQDSPVVSSRKSPFFSDPPFNMNPFMFIDIKASRDVVSESTWSRSNPDEANICVSLYLALVRIAKSSNTTLAGRVGVISPYADQIKLLRSRFDAAGGIATTDDIEIATVDSFQGKEKDIIILSTVRACSESNSVGFLSDLRRMNVAITRAKFGLFVVGRAETLRANPTWAMLVDNAHQTKNGYLEISNCDRDVYDVLAEQIFQKPMPPSIAQPSLYPTL